MKTFAHALIAAVFSGASALELRAHSSAVKEYTLAEASAEVDQTFTWSATHNCDFVTNRVSNQGDPSYDSLVASQNGALWTDADMPIADSVYWKSDAVPTGSGDQ